jgi:5-methylcytosine-specific restriction endonuclease McrA
MNKMIKYDIGHNYVLMLNKVWLPIAILSWRDAIRLLAKGVVKAIDTKSDFNTYDMDEWINVHNKHMYEKSIRTIKLTIPVPEIIACVNYDKHYKKSITLNRENLLIRDGFKCGYCLKELKLHETTLDHIIPRAKGGRTMWSNMVSSCKKCNAKKGDNNPVGEFEPKIKPIEPSLNNALFQLNAKLHGKKYPEIWDKFLFLGKK